MINKSNYGNKIKSLEEVVSLANDKKCVIFHGSIMPAAFLQNMQLRLVSRYIKKEWLYVYVKNSKTNKEK